AEDEGRLPAAVRALYLDVGEVLRARGAQNEETGEQAECEGLEARRSQERGPAGDGDQEAARDRDGHVGEREPRLRAQRRRAVDPRREHAARDAGEERDLARE